MLDYWRIDKRIVRNVKYVHDSIISTADPSSMNLMDSLEQLMKEEDISVFLSPSFILRITLLSSRLPGISSSAMLKSMKASLILTNESSS